MLKLLCGGVGKTVEVYRVRGYNFVDGEEFEIIDGVYVSDKRVMTYNMLVEDRDHPLSRLVLDHLGTPTYERLREVFGISENDVVVIGDGEIKRLDAAYLYVHEDGVELQRIGGAGYIFGENYTYRLTTDAVYYGESREGCRIIVDGVDRDRIPAGLRRLMVGGALCSYIRGFLRWEGEMEFVFHGATGKRLAGKVTYGGKIKSSWAR